MSNYATAKGMPREHNLFRIVDKRRDKSKSAKTQLVFDRVEEFDFITEKRDPIYNEIVRNRMEYRRPVYKLISHPKA